MTENDKTLVAWLYLEAAGAEDKEHTNILNEIAARIEDLSAENERLREALRELLEDSQHVDHNCGDEDCPVLNARAALEETK